MARIPDEYRQYMSKMNDMVEGGFTFKNCPDSWTNQWGDRFNIRSYPAENYSFFTTNRNGGSNISVFSFKNNDGMSPINLQASAKLTLNITGSGNSYTGAVENITDINIAYKRSTNYQYIDLKVNSDWTCSIYSGSSYGNISNATNNVTLTQTGTLAEVLDYFSARLRNVDVYVNGVPWDDIVTYQWQSVPSISGKNGILSLAQIKEEYIEDGEPTSSAEETCFDNLLRVNKVATLIEASLPEPEVGGTTVTVSYLIEATLSGSYTYCKLVAKRNKIPNDVTDGDKIIDLDPTKTSVTIKNLRGLTKYYFVIFVKDSNNLEASSEPKSITTGETHDIILFTDEFNTSILKSGWALDVYKSMFSNGSSGWAPTSFARDFLSNYNFLCGNASRRQLSMSNGELWTANDTGMTDQTFWIPIERTYINESIVVSFDGKISPIGWSSSYYNYIHVWLAYVDDNNTWHSYDACGDIVTDQQWHTFEQEVQTQFPYIDYIGLCCCDGSSHWKNVKVINS